MSGGSFFSETTGSDGGNLRVQWMKLSEPQECLRWTASTSSRSRPRILVGRFSKQGHHRKWAAVLERTDFDEFVDRLRLVAEDVQTMGSVGAPGFGFGWAPAISFTSRNPDAIQSAYVTPIPEVRKAVFDERDWERVRGAVLAIYGRE